MKKFAALIILYIWVMAGCKKPDFGTPAIKNATLTLVSPDSFSLAGARVICNTALDMAGQDFTYGFCYALKPNPVIPGLATSSKNYSSGSFSTLITLEYGKKYYIKAFVTNGYVTTYSNQDSFVMPNYVSSGQVKHITSGTFDIDIAKLAGLTDSIQQWGICYGTIAKPTVKNLTSYHTSTLGDSVTLNINDTLKPGTIYYVRSLVVSGGQAFYGNEVSFKTAGYKGNSGGYVFYDKGDSTNGWRYLETAPDTSIIANASWGCAGVTIPGLIQGMGAGYENSNAIVATCNLDGVAAKICRSLLLKTKTDWYLPSVDELVALYQLKRSGIISGSAILISSNQVSSTDCRAVDFSTGQQQQVSKSDTTVLVWPVRRY